MEIAQQSFAQLVNCVALGGELWTSLQNLLVLVSYEENLDFFYRLIYPLLYATQTITITNNTKCRPF